MMLRRSLSRTRDLLIAAVPAAARLEVAARAWWLRRSMWDLAFLAELPWRPEATAVDVGANIGVYSSVLARKFGRVVAFEANPRLHRRLRAAVPASVELRGSGLSDAAGRATLRIPLANGAPAFGFASLSSASLDPSAAVEEVQVSLARLDDSAPDRIDFLKIDVEGHELQVLEGGAATIARTRPVALVECEERHVAGAPARLFDFFGRLGYQGVFCYEGTLQDVAGFRAEVHQRAEALDHAASYANSFLFLPAGQAPALRPLLARVASLAPSLLAPG